MKKGFAAFVLLFAANVHAEEPDIETLRVAREIVRCGGYHIGFADHMAANPLSPDGLKSAEAAEASRQVGRRYLFLAYHLLTLDSDYTMADAEKRWQKLRDNSIRVGALLLDNGGNAAGLVADGCGAKFNDMAVEVHSLWLEHEVD